MREGEFLRRAGCRKRRPGWQRKGGIRRMCSEFYAIVSYQRAPVKSPRVLQISEALLRKHQTTKVMPTMGDRRSGYLSPREGVRFVDVLTRPPSVQRCLSRENVPPISQPPTLANGREEAGFHVTTSPEGLSLTKGLLPNAKIPNPPRFLETLKERPQIQRRPCGVWAVWVGRLGHSRATSVCPHTLIREFRSYFCGSLVSKPRPNGLEPVTEIQSKGASRSPYPRSFDPSFKALSTRPSPTRSGSLGMRREE